MKYVYALYDSYYAGDDISDLFSSMAKAKIELKKRFIETVQNIEYLTEEEKANKIKTFPKDAKLFEIKDLAEESSFNTRYCKIIKVKVN